MTARRLARLARVGAALAASAAAILVRRREGREEVHRLARRLLRALHVQVMVRGDLPARGLVVCNHLGYLDILVLAAAGPTVFVAKSEVRTWPVFGWFARRAGTIFVERGRAAGAGASVAQIEAALDRGARVVLFPEGTSSGGAAVLPFKSSLLAAARRPPVGLAALHYALDPGDGQAAEEVCYWKDMALPAHLFRLLGRRRIRAALALASATAAGGDRKLLARELRARVQSLKDQAEGALAAGTHRPRRGGFPTAWTGSAPRA